MVVKYFSSWLKKNNSRFNHKLKIIERGVHPYMGEYIRLQYHGIIPDIKVFVYENGINLEVYYYGKLFDMLVDLEIDVEKLKPGQYCCRLCREYDSENMKIYNTAIELIYDHTYEDLLNWSNDKISAENYLFLRGAQDGWSCASICTEERYAILNKKSKRREETLKKLLDSVVQISSLKAFRSD